MTLLFQLRFPNNQIHYWAGRYDYPKEDLIEFEVAPRIRTRGYCTKDDLWALCDWKSPRIKPRCAANEAAFVEAVTRTALSTPNEHLREIVLTLLSGVGWPMASVILHFGHTRPYPILDFRALWSLGIDPPPIYSFEFWWEYTRFCRELAHESNVSMRVLDRALWQYSYENQ
jgi:hypothetical protein